MEKLVLLLKSLNKAKNNFDIWKNKIARQKASKSSKLLRPVRDCVSVEYKPTVFMQIFKYRARCVSD